jgi:hypothetical protein
MELPFNISADPDSVRRRIIPSLPSGVDPLDVAVFPRMASDSSPSVDVLVNPFAAQSLHDNQVSSRFPEVVRRLTSQDLKSELAALRRELKSANDLHVVELAALREATEELRHTRLQLGSLNVSKPYPTRPELTLTEGADASQPAHEAKSHDRGTRVARQALLQD